jgi:hypothetical protein
MHTKAIDRAERKCLEYSEAQAAIRAARAAGVAGALAVPVHDSVRVSVTTASGSYDVVGVKHDQLPAFVAQLAADPTVVRFTVGAKR